MSTFREMVDKRIQEIRDASIEPKTLDDVVGGLVGVAAMSELCYKRMSELLGPSMMSYIESLDEYLEIVKDDILKVGAEIDKETRMIKNDDAITIKEISEDDLSDEEVEQLRHDLQIKRRKEFDDADDKRYLQGLPGDRDQ